MLTGLGNVRKTGTQFGELEELSKNEGVFVFRFLSSRFPMEEENKKRDTAYIMCFFNEQIILKRKQNKQLKC